MGRLLRRAITEYRYPVNRFDGVSFMYLYVNVNALLF